MPRAKAASPRRALPGDQGASGGRPGVSLAGRLAAWDEAARYSAPTRDLLYAGFAVAGLLVVVVTGAAQGLASQAGVATMDALIFTALAEPFFQVRGERTLGQDRGAVLARQGVIWVLFTAAVLTAEASRSPVAGGAIALLGMAGLSLASRQFPSEQERS